MNSQLRKAPDHYLDCLIKAYRKNAVGLEAALQVVRDLPDEKRYTWRVFSALKWAFADFEDEYVALDLPHIPESTRLEMPRNSNGDSYSCG